MAARIWRGECVFLATAAAFLAAPTSIVADDTPSLNEVLDGFHANRAAFGGLHVQMLVRRETTQAKLDWYRRYANHLEESAHEDASSSSASERLREQAQQYRARANVVQRVMHTHLEFFTNRRGYQFRTPATDPHAESWRFPTAELTADSLDAAFKDMRIISYSPDLEPRVRLWHGQLGSVGDAYGYLSNKPLGQLGPSYSFPPLTRTAKAASWGDGPWHLIDELFMQPVENYQVLGVETIAGRRLVILKVVQEATGSGMVVTDDQGEQKIITPFFVNRAWIDPARGFLPVRWENRMVSNPDDPKVFEEPVRYNLHVTKIVAVEGGGFYPAESVQEGFGPDPAEPVVPLGNPQQQGNAISKQVVHDRVTWTCHQVEARRDLSDEFFVLAFPDDLPQYDLDAGKSLDALAPKPPVRPGEPAPELQVARWLDGKSRTLPDLRGQVVVVDFWGLWCGPCLNTVPGLKELEKLYHDKPVTFLSVHTAHRKPDQLDEQLRKFLEEQQWRAITGIDAGTMVENSATAYAYGVAGFPTTVVINSAGKIAFNSSVMPDDPRQIDREYRELARAAGVPWPIPEGLPREELILLQNRLFVAMMRREIDAALATMDAREADD